MSEDTTPAEREASRKLDELEAETMNQAYDRASGLPQSEHGGLHPELRARITAADAALGDFFREHEERKLTGAVVDYVSWAGRLAGELRGLLDTIGRLS